MRTLLRQKIYIVLLVCSITGCSHSKSVEKAMPATGASASPFDVEIRIPSKPIQKATVLNGLQTVPYAAQVERLFPRARVAHLFSESPNNFDPRSVLTWNTVVLFGGRYELTYQVEVVPDFANRRIREVVGKPRFTLEQLSKVVDTAGGLGAYFCETRRFNGADFEKVLAAKGDFSVIGIRLDLNHPIPRFDQFIDAGAAEDYKVMANNNDSHQ